MDSQDKFEQWLNSHAVENASQMRWRDVMPQETKVFCFIAWKAGRESMRDEAAKKLREMSPGVWANTAEYSINKIEP